MHNFGENSHLLNFMHAIEKSVYALFHVSFLYLSLKFYSFHHMVFYYTFLISIVPRYFLLIAFYYKLNIFELYFFSYSILKPVSAGI